MKSAVYTLLLATTLISVSCSRSKHQASEGQPALSGHNEFAIAAQGEPFDLSLEPDGLTFCDKRGARTFFFTSGREISVKQRCVNNEENLSCGDLGLDVQVRAPFSEPNDIVDTVSELVPLQGRVHDCAADGKLLAVITGSEVVVIDTANEKKIEVSAAGGDRVAIGHGWIAWTDFSNIHLKSVPR